MTIDDVLALVRPPLHNLQPYSSARDEFDSTESGATSFVYLDANENPFSTAYNRYPDPHQRKLKKKISGVKGVSESNIFLGNGSDEAIDLIIRVFCSAGVDNVIIPTPTYGMYKVSSEINDITIRTLPLTADFDIDPLAVLALSNENTKIVFICSPNNPSGNLISTAAITEILLRSGKIVVIDEAYIDFTNSPGWLEKLDQFPNLIVLHTLSKAWGMAGLRLGLAFANKAIIEILDKVKPPYNINSISQQIAFEVLSNESAKEKAVNAIVAERIRMASELQKVKSVIKVYPSDANFLLVKIERASIVYRKLVSSMIVVRDRSQIKQCDDCLRITIGTLEENDKLISALRNL